MPRLNSIPGTHGGRREPTPSCPLTSTCEPWHVHPLRLNVKNSKEMKCSVVSAWESKTETSPFQGRVGLQSKALSQGKETGGLGGRASAWLTGPGLGSQAGSVLLDWSQGPFASPGYLVGPTSAPPRCPQPLETHVILTCPPWKREITIRPISKAGT